MRPEIVGALVAAPLSLAGALIMRGFEALSRSRAWLREDRLRFLQDKRQAYSEFLAACGLVVTHSNQDRSDDIRRLFVSLQSVILLAPKELVASAQNLCNLALAAGETQNDADRAKFANQSAAFTNAARVGLGSEP